MTKSILHFLVASMLTFGTAGLAFAQTTTGQILAIRVNDVNGVARVSVRMQKTSQPCAVAGWYAFDSAATGTGHVMSDLLAAAYASGRPVTIGGTGTCDAFGVEKVSYIDVQ